MKSFIAALLAAATVQASYFDSSNCADVLIYPNDEQYNTIILRPADFAEQSTWDYLFDIPTTELGEGSVSAAGEVNPFRSGLTSTECGQMSVTFVVVDDTGADVTSTYASNIVFSETMTPNDANTFTQWGVSFNNDDGNIAEETYLGITATFGYVNQVVLGGTPTTVSFFFLHMADAEPLFDASSISAMLDTYLEMGDTYIREYLLDLMTLNEMLFNGLAPIIQSVAMVYVQLYYGPVYWLFFPVTFPLGIYLLLWWVVTIGRMFGMDLSVSGLIAQFGAGGEEDAAAEA